MPRKAWFNVQEKTTEKYWCPCIFGYTSVASLKLGAWGSLDEKWCGSVITWKRREQHTIRIWNELVSNWQSWAKLPEFSGLLSALQVGLSLNDETEPDADRGDQKAENYVNMCPNTLPLGSDPHYRMSIANISETIRYCTYSWRFFDGLSMEKVRT